MAVQNSTHSQRDESAPANARLLRTLGIIGMLGAPMMLVSALYVSATRAPQDQSNPVIGALGIFYIIGWMCTAIGMRPASAVIFTIQVIGLCLAFVFTVLEALKLSLPRETLAFQVTDAAWPLSHIFMLVIGGMVIKAKVWRGWKAAAPFIPPMGLLIFLAGMACGLRDAFFWTFPVITAAGFLMLGNAVRTGAVNHK
jgi:hypothetical protein